MKTPSVFVLLALFLFPPCAFADFQNEIVLQDVVGTIGYCDDVYFTVILKPDFTKAGDQEIGFAKTDALQLAPMQTWEEIKPGLAVRVTYEEVIAPAPAVPEGEEPAAPVVLERRAVKLFIGQKPQRKALAS